MRASGLLRASSIGATYPNATNTGASLPASLYAISNGVATTAGSAVAAGFAGNTGWTWSGTTWSYSGTAPVLSALNVPVELDINASNTTVESCAMAYVLVADTGPVSNTLITNCLIIHAAGGTGEGIKLGGGGANIPTDTTIQDCTISGTDATTNRLSYCIDDNYANAAGVLVQRCNFYWMRVGVNLTGAPGVSIPGGYIRDCYFHDFGFISGDHIDGITNGGTGQWNNPAAGNISAIHNTMLMQYTQTAPLPWGGANYLLQNALVSDNFLAGGGYTMYLGTQGQGASRTDTHLGGSDNTTTVTDANAAASDFGAVITNTSTPSSIPAFTTIISVDPVGNTYTLSAPTTGGSLSSQTFVISGNTRTDTGCTTTLNSATVTDPRASPGDYGQPISGPNIPLNTVITNVNTGASQYTLSGSATASGTALTFVVRQQCAASRTDTGLGTTFTGGSATTVLDSRAALYDVGATISGPNLTGPPYPTIATVNPGVGYTISGSGATGAGTGLSMVVRYTNNIVVQNNRISQVYFPQGGFVGPFTDYDNNVPSNTWTNNVYHETGAQIPS